MDSKKIQIVLVPILNDDDSFVQFSTDRELTPLESIFINEICSDVVNCVLSGFVIEQSFKDFLKEIAI